MKNDEGWQAAAEDELHPTQSNEDDLDRSQITPPGPWAQPPRYLIRDRDRVYNAAVTHRLRAMGIRDKAIAPGSPWQNGFTERLIGSIRRECVDILSTWAKRTYAGS
jgi:transposase InsO family protein